MTAALKILLKNRLKKFYKAGPGRSRDRFS
jgi:hypothetical protein